jgi:hypothetical protein
MCTGGRKKENPNFIHSSKNRAGEKHLQIQSQIKKGNRQIPDSDFTTGAFFYT